MVQANLLMNLRFSDQNLYIDQILERREAGRQAGAQAGSSKTVLEACFLNVVRPGTD